MKRCPQCSQTFAENVEFCGNDGARLVSEIGNIAAPQINISNAPAPPAVARNSQPPNAQTQNAAWKREFRQRTGLFGKIVLIVILTVLATMFAFPVLAFIFGDLYGDNPIAPAIVGVALVMFSIITFSVWYFIGTIHIVCEPQGFSVTKESRRRGKTERRYKWQDVVNTKYEIKNSSSQKSGATSHVFEVETKEGVAFKVMGGYVNDFNLLIQIFNSMTPHLPYVWQQIVGKYAGNWHEKAERMQIDFR